jgi:hypothetical protein
MLRGKGLRSILVALVLSVFLICWGGNVQAAPKKEITIAFSAFAPTLDPQVQFAMPTYSMCRFMFDPLIYFDLISPGSST